jgi:glycosyltransferase involved in cell wall biosynthesis
MHPAFKLVDNECAGKYQIIYLEDIEKPKNSNIWSLLKRQFDYYRAIKTSFAKLRTDFAPDMIYLINLDYLDKVLALCGSPFGRSPFAGMIMSAKFHCANASFGPLSRKDIIYESLFRRMLRIRDLKTVTIINEAFLEYVIGSNHSEYAKIRLVPDVGELHGDDSREQARQYFSLPAGAFVILVYGSLSERKGIACLLNVLSGHKFSRHVTVILAGKQSDRVRHLLNSPQAISLKNNNSLIELDSFLDDAMEYRVFKSADTVWVGYVGGSYSSSGVLIQAGSVGLPVLATSSGLIGRLTEKHRLGLVFDPMDDNAVAHAINRLIIEDHLHREFGENGRVYAAKHTSDIFGRSICDVIESAVAE